MVFAAEKKTQSLRSNGWEWPHLQVSSRIGIHFYYVDTSMCFKAKGDRCTSSLPASMACWRQPCSPRVPYLSARAGETRHWWAQKRKTAGAGGDPRPTNLSIQTVLQQLWEEAVSWGGGGLPWRRPVPCPCPFQPCCWTNSITAVKAGWRTRSPALAALFFTGIFSPSPTSHSPLK